MADGLQTWVARRSQISVLDPPEPQDQLYSSDALSFHPTHLLPTFRFLSSFLTLFFILLFQVVVAVVVGTVSGIYIFTPVIDYMKEETRKGRERQVGGVGDLLLPVITSHVFLASLQFII